MLHRCFAVSFTKTFLQKTSGQLLTIKAPPQMFDRILNTPLHSAIKLMASKSIKHRLFEAVSHSCSTEYGKIHNKTNSIESFLEELHANRLHVRYFTMNSWELDSRKLEKYLLQNTGDCFHAFQFDALSTHVYTTPVMRPLKSLIIQNFTEKSLLLFFFSITFQPLSHIPYLLK